jgi:secreted trypsin-like serine protease
MIELRNKNLLILITIGSYSGGKDTCQGDSGGGLYSFDSNLSKFVVMGITSYGKDCALAGYPGFNSIKTIKFF